jgi:hypothetical protein
MTVNAKGREIRAILSSISKNRMLSVTRGIFGFLILKVLGLQDTQMFWKGF